MGIEMGISLEKLWETYRKHHYQNEGVIRKIIELNGAFSVAMLGYWMVNLVMWVRFIAARKS